MLLVLCFVIAISVSSEFKTTFRTHDDPHFVPTLPPWLHTVTPRLCPHMHVLSFATKTNNIDPL